jgi:thiol-disulfide isomerase/thioredoxin
VLLDFWATWCAPCREFLPTIEHIQKEFGTDEAFFLVTVSLDNERSALEGFIKTHDMPWQILYTDIGHDEWKKNEFAKEFGVFGIPSVWIIDKNGTVAAKEIRDEKKLKQKISELIREPYTGTESVPENE